MAHRKKMEDKSLILYKRVNERRQRSDQITSYKPSGLDLQGEGGEWDAFVDNRLTKHAHLLLYCINLEKIKIHVDIISFVFWCSQYGAASAEHLLVQGCNLHSLLCILGIFGSELRVCVSLCGSVLSTCGDASARSHRQLWKHLSPSSLQMLLMWSSLETMSIRELSGSKIWK